MREIVSLQVGRCGNNVGGKFWEAISDEHGLTADGAFAGESEIQLQRTNVYFSEAAGSRFVPRAVLVDLDPDGFGSLVSGPLGRTFKPESFVAGRAGAANVWAKGYYTEGAELAEAALDAVRAEAESCDLMQGIQMVHSVGGGTGSGMGSLLTSKIKEEYPERILKCYSVIPSWNASDVVVEPYNAILAIGGSIECTDQTFCVENRALQRICSRVLKISAPSFADSNSLIAGCMTAVTACLRFPGQLNTDLRKLQANLVPFPRLHFFVPGIAPLAPLAPLASRSCGRFAPLSVPELTRQLFNARNMLAICEPTTATFLTVAAIFRGRTSPKLVDEQTTNARNRNGGWFVEWIPNNVQTAICDVPPRGLVASAAIVANTTAIGRTIERLSSVFDRMLEKKAYVHWYTAEGMEESEFFETRKKVRDLVSEYRQRGEETVEPTGFEDERLRYEE